ncbi:class I SAM-dependent methyltransferase [Brevundimonas terrae]|uniref:Class I SAM-dependent methyltransferase n=1 Tax=Brevundimonas terrae TaxID=363631 RepID=A0ABP3I0U4_9CAUL|nr:class I SAM-dependent methyltransferase [Brevundimonas terrae]NIJ28021.1 SAM-dependent methyltransferase [Brevundimonas terrae]
MTVRALKLSLGDSEDTIAWYDRSAAAYSDDTLKRDPVDLCNAFVGRLPERGVILDAGSGSGRDTLAFLGHGFEVEAFDASQELARLSSTLTGRKTQVARFETYVGPQARYDGIWAFASLLHVREPDLPDVLARLARTLKSGGCLFANFKVGDGERCDEFGRLYTDMDERRLQALFSGSGLWTEVEIGTQQASAAFGTPTAWISVFALRA